MASDVQGGTLVRRIVREHRRMVVPLAIALGVNLVVYGGVVYPLSQRVANIEQRDRTAEEELMAAQRDHAQAAGTLTGKDRAAAELTTFYKDVLPSDLAGARRLTQLRLAQLARESKLKFIRATFEPVAPRSRTLTQLKIEMALAGAYTDMRAFLHELEAAPEFVVIDNIELGQGADGGPLGVTLHLSTYYRDTGPRDEVQ
ncbi:MAG TPA: type 4a pilus biogenesis protein PilO [Vicinamibacterales bacterium]|nr:type 4a pilus biogenesis protein PilO [Vicinamibacterales bacterium]